MEGSASDLALGFRATGKRDAMIFGAAPGHRSTNPRRGPPMTEPKTLALDLTGASLRS